MYGGGTQYGSGQYSSEEGQFRYNRVSRDASSNSNSGSYEQQEFHNRSGAFSGALPDLNKPLPSINTQQSSINQQPKIPVVQYNDNNRQKPSPVKSQYIYSEQYNYFQNGTNDINESPYYNNSFGTVNPAIILDGPTHNISTTTTTLQHIKTTVEHQYDIVKNNG